MYSTSVHNNYMFFNYVFISSVDYHYTINTFHLKWELFYFT